MSKTLGITASRKGLTELQFCKLQEICIAKFNEGYDKAIHGDCIGGDAEFHEICFSIGYDIMCRPSNYYSTRAHTNARAIADPIAPMTRNYSIVTDADLMLGCPYNFSIIKRGSGTWNAISIARKTQKPLIIIFPDGSVLKENGAQE